MEKSSMTTLAAEMREAVTFLGGIAPRKRLFETAARRAGITFRQAKSLFYWEGNPRSEVVERVREAVRNRRKEELEAGDDLADLKARIARLESYLVTTDPDMAGPQVSALRDSIGGLDGTRGAHNRPVDRNR